MSHLRNRHLQTAVRFHTEGKTRVFRTRNSSPQVGRLHPDASQRIKTEPDFHMKTLYNQ